MCAEPSPGPAEVNESSRMQTRDHGSWPSRFRGATAPPAEVAYDVDAARSSVVINVGRSGVFSFAGHTHTVAGPGRARPGGRGGQAISLGAPCACPSKPRGSTVQERGEPAGDAPKVQEAMLGPKVLDAAPLPRDHLRVDHRRRDAVERRAPTS